MFRQIQQKWQIQAAHHCFGLRRAICKVQSSHLYMLNPLDETDFFQIWIKPNGEMPFLYGNHVVKAHLGRITEDTPEHQGVVVFSMNDIPLVRDYPALYDFSNVL